jgi:hypothetical protein
MRTLIRPSPAMQSPARRDPGVPWHSRRRHAICARSNGGRKLSTAPLWITLWITTPVGNLWITPDQFQRQSGKNAPVLASI